MCVHSGMCVVVVVVVGVGGKGEAVGMQECWCVVGVGGITPVLE